MWNIHLLGIYQLSMVSKTLLFVLYVWISAKMLYDIIYIVVKAQLPGSVIDTSSVSKLICHKITKQFVLFSIILN
jgi:hypothetical protein